MRAEDVSTLVVAGIFGSMLGSFLNVVIHRLPDRKSIVWPGSSCPSCSTPIRWYDNVPIFSWLILLGRCRNCKAPISPRYVLVELLTAGLTVALAARYLVGGGDRNWGMFFVALVFLAALVPVSFIDLKLRIIPDLITKPGMAVSVVCSLAAPEIHQISLLPRTGPAVAALLLCLTGMAVGAGSIWLMGVLGKAVFKKEAMGFGDVKLMGMIGGFVGPVGVLLVLVLGCALGAIVGILAWVITKNRYIPFGPFLSAGAVAVHFFRPEIVHFLTVTYPGWMR